jgi:Co/Zn/Cd efflux system component
MGIERAQSTRLRTAVLWVAALNLAYFGVEFTTALAIGSVSLFADSVDFLEDASINILIAVAIGWTARRRAFLGMMLAIILLIPALAGLWTAWQKLASPVPPAPLPLTLTGMGALVVNLSCAFILARFRDHRASPRQRFYRRATTRSPMSRSSRPEA